MGNPNIIPVSTDIQPATLAYEETAPAPDQEQDALSSYPGCSPEDKQRQYDAVANSHDTFDQLATVTHPTLIQTGTADMMFNPENSRIMARMIPNARLIEYEGCGHDYLTQSGEEAVTDILAFLKIVDNSEQ
ncbi:MAG: alpha/beta hydrolase [Caldilineaceae bacterium]